MATVPRSANSRLLSKHVVDPVLACECALLRSGSGRCDACRNAGAAIVLTAAYLVDPANEGEIAKAMRDALLADGSEMLQRTALMLRRIQRQTALKWTDDFLDALCVG